jgi:hypothetical protein
MRRREFIALIGGTALAYPHSLYAQPAVERRRRIGVLMVCQKQTQQPFGAGRPSSKNSKR